MRRPTAGVDSNTAPVEKSTAEYMGVDAEGIERLIEDWVTTDRRVTWLQSMAMEAAPATGRRGTRTMSRTFLIVEKSAEAALFIAAVIVIGVPEARTTAMRGVLVLLLVLAGLPGLWQAYRRGQLRMTPGELYRTSYTRPRGMLLGLLAPLTGVAALLVAAL